MKLSRSVIRVVRVAVAVLALTLLAVEHRPAVGRRGRRAGPAGPGVVRAVPASPRWSGCCSPASPGGPCWPTSAARCRSARHLGCSSWPRSGSTCPARCGRSSPRWSSAGRSACRGSAARSAGLLFVGLHCATGLLVASATLPFASPDAAEDYWWVLALTPVLLVVLHPRVLSPLLDRAFWLLRRPPLDRPLSCGSTVRACGFLLVTWSFYGLSLLALAGPLGLSGRGSFFLATGAYALAWSAGVMVLGLVPAGIGVREVVLGAVLLPVLPAGAATAVVAASRVVQTLGDAIWAVVAGVALRGSMRRAALAAADRRPGRGMVQPACPRSGRRRLTRPRATVGPPDRRGLSSARPNASSPDSEEESDPCQVRASAVGVVVVTYSPGADARRLPGHPGEGDDAAGRGGARRQRLHRRRAGAGGAAAGRASWSGPAATSATAAPPTSASRGRPATGWWSPTRTCAGSRARWTPCWTRSSGGRGPACSGPAILSVGRHPLPVRAGAAVARPRHRARAARLVVAVEPVDGGVPAGAGRPARRARPAGCPGPACCCAGRRSTRSAASTRRTSCTSRTSTCASGSAGRVGRPSTCRPRSSSTRAGRRPAGTRARWRTRTTPAPGGTCPGATPAGAGRPSGWR